MRTHRDVPIRDGTIRLGQFLKHADLIDNGADAKPLMIQGLVTVNGDTETPRGRQLVKGAAGANVRLMKGDVVTIGDMSVRVA